MFPQSMTNPRFSFSHVFPNVGRNSPPQSRSDETQVRRRQSLESIVEQLKARLDAANQTRKDLENCVAELQKRQISPLRFLYEPTREEFNLTLPIPKRYEDCRTFLQLLEALLEERLQSLPVQEDRESLDLHFSIYAQLVFDLINPAGLTKEGKQLLVHCNEHVYLTTAACYEVGFSEGCKKILYHPPSPLELGTRSNAIDPVALLLLLNHFPSEVRLQIPSLLLHLKIFQEPPEPRTGLEAFNQDLSMVLKIVHTMAKSIHERYHSQFFDKFWCPRKKPVSIGTETGPTRSTQATQTDPYDYDYGAVLIE